MGFHTSFFTPNSGGIKTMKKTEKIKTLEKEIARLTILLNNSPMADFERLNQKLEREIENMRECKERYKFLIMEVEALKKKYNK